jgi:hypothetical protein
VIPWLVLERFMSVLQTKGTASLLGVMIFSVLIFQTEGQHHFQVTCL